MQQRLAASAGPIADTVLLVGFLVMTRRVIWRSRRERYFAGGIADGFQRIGWWLLIGSVAAGLIDSLGTGLLVADATTGNSVANQFLLPAVNLYVVLGGLIFISFARILRWAVPLQEEVDTLV